MSNNVAKLLLLVMTLSVTSYLELAATPSAGSIQEKDVQYSCPMHPEIKSKTPGICPKCGMTLRPSSPPEIPTTPGSSRWGANYFPNVELTTQDGATVHFYDDLLKDKIVAIDLIYTHCQYNCPLETARLAQVQKLLGDRVGKDIFFYSITIDPERDTPAALKAYAEKFHAGPGWLFLTGKQADIQLISRKLGLYSEPDPDDKDGHTPTLMIGNVAAGQWMRNSALDNPRFLVIKLEQILGWQNRKIEPLKSYAQSPGLSFTKGQYLFSTRCAACHTIGGGDRVGPDLFGVTRRRDQAWLRRFIAEPDKMLEQKDPIATSLLAKYKGVQMSNTGLAESDVASLVDYLETQTAAASKEKDRNQLSTIG